MAFKRKKSILSLSDNVTTGKKETEKEKKKMVPEEIVLKKKNVTDFS
jgi:hypothetical protein